MWSWQWDFKEHTTPNDVVTVIATAPLTSNEQWQTCLPGEWRLWQGGETLLQGRVPVVELLPTEPAGAESL